MTRKLILFLVLLFFNLFMVNAQEKSNFGKIHLTQISKTESKRTNQSILYSELNPGTGTEFRVIKTKTDTKGKTHTTYQQYYNGIKVKFGNVIIHEKNGSKENYNGAYFNASNINTTPRVFNQHVIAKAKSFMGSNDVFWLTETEFSYTEPTPELLILPNRRTNELNLVYAVGVGTSIPHLKMGTVYVDAHTGEIIKYKNQLFACFKSKEGILIHNEHEHNGNEVPLVNGTAATAYSGSQNFETKLDGTDYVLNDETRATGSSWNLSTQGLGTKTGIITVDMQTGTDVVNGPIYEFTDGNNNWTAAEMSANEDQYALDVHWGAQIVYDYWSNEHGWNSYNGNNSALMSLVHYSSNYTNAAWAAISNSAGYMIYGDGDGAYTPLTSLDVTAHEIAHGINNATSDLDYELESGALNEGLSDIWAMVLENYSNDNHGTSKDFSQINEENGGGAFRDLSNPNAYSQPDTYGGAFWYDVNGCTPDGDANSGGYNDYCGVHTNSGVLNYWFWLVSQGGSGTNDNGDSFSVTAIGMDDAASIVWQMQENYLTSTSDFADARTHAIQAAVDLFGSCSTQEQSVTDAFYAVGVGSAYVVVNPSVTTQPSDASTCEGDATSFYSAGSDADSLQWQVNDGNGWTDVGNDATYSGATNNTLNITNPVYSMDDYEYRLEYTNSCSSVTSNSVTLSIDEYAVASVVAQNETCAGGDGSLIFTFDDNSNRTNLEFSIDGGSNYDYYYDDTAGSETVTDLNAATYNIWVRWGDNDCPYELGDYVISTGTTPTASVSNTINETCTLNDGGIEVSFSDAATETQIDFSIDGGVTYGYSFDDTLGTSNITGLTAGDYEIWASYGGNCAVSLGTTTVNSDAPIATVAVIDASTGNSDGALVFNFEDHPTRNAVKFSIDGGVNYDYGFMDNLGTGSAAGLAAATYTIWVAWGNESCPRELGDYTINESSLYTSISDNNFENALYNLGYDDFNGDNKVPTALIDTVQWLNVAYEGITDLTGIEAFVAMTNFDCRYNNLTSIDLTSNVLLDTFKCDNNSTLTSVNTSANTALLYYEAFNCDLSIIDISNNLSLLNLEVYNNNLTSLDLSSHTSLEVLDCNNNSLTHLNFKNGNNSNTSNGEFDATGNTGLTCIEVDDSAYSTTTWTNVDGTVTFSDYCTYTAIPDNNFEAALEALGYDDVSSDGQVPTALINTVVTLDIDGENISDLTGIESFIALEELDVDNNSLTNIDVSTLGNLRILRLDYSNLTSLDVTNNTNLETLSFRDNTITAIDLSNNIALKTLHFQFNDVVALDLTNNTALTGLICRGNDLTTLDLSQNTALTNVWAGDNFITSIDISNNALLTVIQLYNNSLTYADLRNGNNTIVSNFSFTNNSNLSCILVDDAAYSTTNWTNLDSHTSFYETSCGYTATPDANFEAALEALGYDNISGDGQVPTNWIDNVSSLNVENENISDLTGIEDFIDLATLDCSNNSLSSIDVSLLTNLILIHVPQNNLTNLNVNTLSLLQVLDCDDNNITSLDLSNNSVLNELTATNNDLSYLNIQNGNNTYLGLEGFQVQDNTNLTCIIVDDVAYSDAVWTDIDNQMYFTDDAYCNYTIIPDVNFENALEALGYDDVSSDGRVPTDLISGVTNLSVNSSNISDLTGIEDFVSLTTLECYLNTISSLDVSTLTNLTVLKCRNNNLTTLDVSNNPLLDTINCRSNYFTELDFSNNPLLRILNCRSNLLTSLDLSLQSSLKDLEVQSNLLESLSVKNGNNTNVVTFIATGNSNLTCVQVDDAAYSTTNWTNIDAQTSFNDAYCRYTAIPDTNFEAALDALGYDDVASDGQVPTANIETITTLHVNSSSISDLTGIEDFTALSTLNCNTNSLATLDISLNLNLTFLNCTSNNLTSLNISTNSLLATLICNENQLTSLDVTNNGQLDDLRLVDNQLTTIDLSNNLLLSNLDITDNSFTTLDVSSNVALEFLTIFGNLMTTIDLSNNTILSMVDFGDNPITSIDLSNNLVLTEIYAYDANITGNFDLSNHPLLIDVDFTNNDLSTLDIRNGNNTNIGFFDTRGNNNLTCISVDDAVYSTTNWTNIDAGHAFSEGDYCSYTAIPDLNFENALDALGYDDISGDGQVPTSLISGVTSLDVNSLNITDLTGIEDFVALETLTCYLNTINTLDLSNNIALENLYADYNDITSLNIENITTLKKLYCGNNQLTSLDLSSNTGLTEVYVATNLLTYLNLKNGTNTQIGTNFDARSNLNLTCISVDDAAYATTNWTNIDGTASFSDSYCNYTAIPDANFEAWLENNGYDNISNDGQVPTALIEVATSIATSFENITDFTGIEDFTALESLTVSYNSFTSLNVSNNLNLTFLNCGYSNLTSLDVSNNTLLETLWVNNTGITSLDLSLNTNLAALTASSMSSLTYLNVQNGNNTNFTQFTTVATSNLTCIIVDDVAYSDTNWTNIESGTSFSSTYCNYTAIPDSNFEAALEALGYDDISDDGQVPTALIEVVEILHVSSENISSLTGIEDFTALVDLNVSDNSFSSLDLSNNLLLEDLNCSFNNFFNIDLSQNVLLNSLYANDTWLFDIDVSANIQLQYLYLANNTFLNSLNYQNGNNTNNLLFNTTGCSNLNCIAVDDAAYSDTNWTNIESGTSFSSTYCNYTAIPDSNFEAALEALGYDDISGDGQVPTALIEVITILDISNEGIADLTGIQDFDALTTLDCSNNQLSEVDFGNIPLMYLDISSNDLSILYTPDTIVNLLVNSNKLMYLDLTGYTDLEEVNASDNDLIYFNIQNGANTNIFSFIASNNTDLTCILVDDDAYSTTNWTNIDATTSFSTTYCKYTQIPDANFEARLESLGLDDISGDGQVPTGLIIDQESIDLSFNNSGAIYDLTGIQDFYSLYNLILTDNVMTSVDLSSNVNLGLLTANNTALTSIDLSTNPDMNYINVSDCDDLSSVNIQNGNNTKLISDSSFSATNVPNLFCVLVDDEAFANVTWVDYKDPQISYSDTFCGGYTAIPDANFEARLETLGYDDISGDGQVPTALIEVVTSLTVSNEGISDLTGIEDFTALETLLCDNNTVTSLDLSNNIALEFIQIVNNGLTSININGLTALGTLGVNNNNLTTIDLSTNTALEIFTCSNNSISSLDFTNNINIYYLSLDNISLTNVDITNNTGLEYLYCSNNAGLTTLDITNNTSLLRLSANNNSLSAIDVSNNVLLENLWIYDNSLTSLIVDSNVALEELVCYNNNLTAIDVSANTLLDWFYCDGNSIESLDLTNNTALTSFNCSNNELKSLNLQNGNNASLTFAVFTDNTNLNCILVDDASYSTTNWTNIDSQTSFNETSCLVDYQIAIKAYLQGALLNPNTGEETLMRDDLRVANYIPITSPFGDGLTCASTVFDVTGTDAIVDWVWVELRDKTDNTSIIASQSALIQRDGDIVGADGVSALTFELGTPNVYVVVNHRNHLGIMTNTVVVLDEITTAAVDFTDANNQITYGTDAQTDFGMPSGVAAMWAGDATGDGYLNYSGTLSDVSSIRIQVFNDPNNSVFGGPPVASYPSLGYNATDVDMNGETVYSGTTSDVLYIRNNIFNNPSNSVFGGPPTSTYLFTQQLPEGGN